MNKIIHGDSILELKKLEDNSIDAIVTDPPYGLSFMGKKWDYDVPSVDIWTECLRVLKPGGYLLAFAGTRTQHRMAVRIEDAGFEIRDMIAWVYGSGFPKSLNIGKAIDKLQGNERYITHQETKADSTYHTQNVGQKIINTSTYSITKGTSEWEGWGTALKPSLEPITVARKPLSEKTVALNVLKWGTGGINIDGSRVEGKMGLDRSLGKPRIDTDKYGKANPVMNMQSPLGRFPANFIHDGNEEVVNMFPNTKSKGHNPSMGKANPFGGKNINLQCESYFNDSGSASRFFYCAKTSKSERNKGCEDMEDKQYSHDGREKEIENAYQRNKSVSKNNHPTVKPIKLMEYLINLVSKEGAIILDPFAGSGSTGIACANINRNYVLIERELEYVNIINSRISSK